MKTSLDSRSFVPSLDALIFAVLIGGLTIKTVNVKLAPLLLVLVGSYWLLDWLSTAKAAVGRRTWLGKVILVSLAIALVVVYQTVVSIELRHQTASQFYSHDALIQSEWAVRYITQGLNPYVEDYVNTPMALWHFGEGDLKINPALYHYAYLPLTFLLPLPFQVIAEAIWGWFDQRIVYLALLVVTLIAAGTLSTDAVKRISLVMLLALSPLFAPFLIEGRNDIMPLFWLMLSIAWLRRGSPVASAIALAGACATKQWAWFFVPFYFVYVGGEGGVMQRFARIRKPLAWFVVITALCVLPWLLSSPRAFVEDLFYLQSSAQAGIYPINGMGFGVLLLSLGLIRSNLDPFPFWLLQMIVGVLLLALLIRHQWRVPRLRTAIFSYATLLFVVAFFGRLFNDNHIGFLIALLAIAVFMDDNEYDH